MDPIASYDGKARDYSSYRLPYTHKVLDAIVGTTGLDFSWTLADIGSGTGMLTQLFTSRVGCIYAVEPNQDMRREAQRLLKGYENVKHIPATAENTTLPSNSIDLITIGQALHWFDPGPARFEFARILNPTGWLAVVWNRLGEDSGPDLKHFFSPEGLHRKEFTMSIQETWPQFIGAVRSAAFAPPIDDPNYPEFELAQRRLFDSQASDGLITIEYSTELAVGKLKFDETPRTMQIDRFK